MLTFKKEDEELFRAFNFIDEADDYGLYEETLEYSDEIVIKYDEWEFDGKTEREFTIDGTYHHIDTIENIEEVEKVRVKIYDDEMRKLYQKLKEIYG